MDNMCIFSDAINKSFGYTEFIVNGSTYLVDLSDKNSVAKLFTLTNGNLSSVFKRFSQDELNSLIERIPIDSLILVPYSKAKEVVGNYNWVLYRNDQYRLSSDGNLLYEDKDGVIPEQPINCSSIQNMFSGLSIEELDLEHWDVSCVIDTSWAFFQCWNLKHLSVSSWNVSSVTNMSYMFKGCQLLDELDVSRWRPCKIDNMVGVFKDCKSLKSLDLSNWDVSHVIVTTNLFSNCEDLEQLDISTWDVSSVEITDDMFCGCSSLVELNLDKLEFKKLNHFSGMFKNCSKLKKKDVKCWCSATTIIANYAFGGCDSLESLDLSSLREPYYTISTNMFIGCKKLKTTHNKIFDTILGGDAVE